jgi:hypothetical protein
MIRSSGLLVRILLPVNVREAIVGQGLVDGLLDEVGCLGHLACPQVVDDRLCLVVGGLPALPGVNGLEHMAHLTDPGRRDVAKDIAVEMHHAALVASLRQLGRRGPHISLRVASAINSEGFERLAIKSTRLCSGEFDRQSLG